MQAVVNDVRRQRQFSLLLLDADAKLLCGQGPLFHGARALGQKLQIIIHTTGLQRSHYSQF